jgi:hypothetical protein
MHLTPVPVPVPALMYPGLHVQVTVPVIGHDEQIEFKPQPPFFTEQGTRMMMKCILTVYKYFLFQLTDAFDTGTSACPSIDVTRFAGAGHDCCCEAR